jgi:hypothetical protein
MAQGEYGKCEICGKESNLIRKYYYYSIKCECHSNWHFEVVRHCEKCNPKPPEKTLIYVSPVISSDDKILEDD